MKAKTFDNRPFGWNAVVYDNEDSPMIFALNGLVNKHDAVGITESFNLELSAHVAQETAPLQAEIDRLKKEVERLGSDKWIGVEERLPESDGIYLVCTYAGDVDMIEFNNGVFGVEHQKEFIPAKRGLLTHWQPLPQPK